MRTLLVAALGLLLLPLGCAREHLSPGFGQATRRSFALQQAGGPRSNQPPSPALDTQEAAVISASYLESLSGKASKEPAPVVLVSPQRSGQGQVQQLAPSVPKGQ